MRVDGTWVLLSITVESISSMLLLQNPLVKVHREQLIVRVHNWTLIEKREDVSRFLIDNNSLPNFFLIPSVLFTPIYQQVITILLVILGN
jgi:hypothetical protein